MSNFMKHLTITLIFLTVALSAECVDDATGAFTDMGKSCDFVLNTAGQPCSGDFSGTSIAEECPLSCNNCPGVAGDGVCSSDETAASSQGDCPACDDAPVCLNVLNVNASTLDIHMTNQAGCSYCSGGSGGDTEAVCTGSGGTWTFTASMDLATCTSNNGTYFDGNVVGFQFVLTSASLTTTTASVTGGSAIDLNYTINVNPEYAEDVDNDGTADITGTMILAYSGSMIPIPPGEGALVTVSFTGYADDAICFANQNCSSGACVNEMIGLSGGTPIVPDTNYGDCYCAGGVVADCAGVCGGSAALDACGICSGTCVEFGTNCPNTDGTAHYCNCALKVNDCAGTCGGVAVEDCAGLCGGNDESCLAIYQTSSNLPEEFSISQNFPNPFNPVTSISFDVAEIDEISLVVYDLSGKEVITLASGIFMPGSYFVNWDAVNNYGDPIASGMYVYRYISSDKVITRKMLYLK